MSRVRTYTYIDPDDAEPIDSYPDPIDGPDTILRSAGNRPDFDAGWTAGYRDGWAVGYERARRSVTKWHPEIPRKAYDVPDLAVEEGG